MRMPVAIHIGDPEAFFLPIDRFNERFEELNNHPDWSFHGRDFPTNRQLLDARNRVFARHPKTTFVALHVGHNAEDLGDVSGSLDRYPEHARRDGRARRRTRAVSRAPPGGSSTATRIASSSAPTPCRTGRRPPSRSSARRSTRSTSGSSRPRTSTSTTRRRPTPPQGRWQIYGIGLPEPILRKVYNENATRLLSV